MHFCPLLIMIIFKIEFFIKKNLSGMPSDCQIVCIQIRPDVMSGLIWVQTVSNGKSAHDTIRLRAASYCYTENINFKKKLNRQQKIKYAKFPSMLRVNMYITYLYILIIHVSSSVDGICERMFDLSDYICLSHLVCIPTLGCLKKKKSRL